MDNDLILTTEMFEEAEKYWRDNLSGELIELDFPGDYSRTGQYDRRNFKLSFGEQAAHQLIRISKNNDFLLDVILLTVFKILIHKFTGQNDIIVSSSVLKTSNQSYNKCIALRDFLSPGMTFKELLLEVKETAADGYKYQYYPIRKLIKLLKIENPLALFKFTFLLVNIHEKEFVLDITANGENDIIFSINKNDEGLEGEITYNSNLFKEETIQRLYNGYKRILTQVLSDTNIRLSEINTLTEEEKKEILVDFNNTGAEYPKEKTLHQLFDELAKQKSNHIVSVEMNSSQPDGISCISYRELSERVNRLAVQLCRRGAVSGSVISLMIGHSIDLLVGMLGILKAGCVYLPLDPDYPGDRINLMLSDSGSPMVLISADLADKCQGICFEGEIIEINGGEITGIEESSPSARLTAPDDPAYIIYTSGSTGTPKGVMVEHRNVVRLVKNMNYIDFSREDRMLPTGAIAFDISTFEIWGPLLNGVKLFFVDEPVILDPERLAKIIIENEITILHLIPQLFNQTAAQKIEIFTGLKYLLVGGDVVKPRYINEVRNRHKNLKILQMYGPTENTTFTTYFPVDKNYEVNIPIGKPVANSTVYILDRFYNLQPPGIVGELCTGGDGIARGYLNSPGLTAEKFVSNPFVPGDRLYKTGDLARWLPDGNIEFLGRSDNQVKIRGYRIELGEIERVLSARAKIEEAIIVIKQDEEENPYLCAYFTSGEDIEISELRKYLAGRLPDYMIPLFFVPLDKLPLTPNGKIDRKVLPEPKVKRSDEYAAPRDEVERKLVEIWSEVLRVEKDVIGIDANFFQLGGHSLKATLMAFAVHKELKVKLSMNQVFKTPTIRELARNIKGAEEYKYSVIEPLEEKEYYSLSSAQKRLYIIQQIALEATSYMPYVMPLREEPDKEELENTLRKLIARHESLRTSFKVINDEPAQIIHEDVEFKIQYYDSESVSRDEKTGVNDKVEENREIQHLKFIIQNLFIRPFDLTKAPLLRVGMIRTIEKEYILLFDIHHIITDAISNDILIKDFKALYEEKELPPLRIHYKDFSRWQNSEKEEESIRKQEAYWISQFEGEIPVINLPTDYSRPAVQSIEGDSVYFEIPRDHTAALKAAALKEGVTLYMVVLAVLNVFLAKIANQEDIVVGTAVAGRRHADLEKIIGMFVNTLALRNQPVQEKPFREFLSEIKKKTLEAFENQDYQFEDLVGKVLVNRDAARNPLFDVIYGFQSSDDDSISGDLARLEDDKKTIMKISQYDLIFNGVEQNGKLSFTLHYCTRLFKKETVERFIGCFKQIVIQIIKEPGLELGEIEIISKEEKSRILYDFNDTGTTYPQDKTIHRLFEKQAARTPDVVAVVGNWQGVAPPADKEAVGKREKAGERDEKVQLTYGELNKKSNQLAQVLKVKGVQPDTIVGIMIERSLEMIVGILAILKIGASYLPIDADLPGKRVKYILDDGNVSVLLTKSSIVENHSFIDLQGLKTSNPKVHRTAARKAITDLEKTLPIPDRSYVSYERYSKEIGLAMARHTIAIMATRGCPYRCLYCHKIWPKKHVYRSAENILAEIQIYYNMGIRRYVIVDDIFNLNIENSSRFFKLIIKNKMDVQFFFPNGVRGDLLTKDYIDLMVEAGTIHLALALETASPRLQKLIKKNIDVEKLHENMAYLCKMYPHVYSELFTMHGFPTETEEEAIMTLDFIKSIKWIHLPLVNILKIYPNTDMADFAISCGISEEAIARSENLGYHELPETLPFDKNFTLKYQMDFLDYILSKERLLHVLPYQMKVLTWSEMLQKHNSFLPTEINELDDLLKLAGITREEFGSLYFLEEDYMKVPDLDRKIRQYFTAPTVPIAPKEEKNSLKIILIDVSRFFSGECDMLYDVGEPPLGLMYLLTYLKKIYGRKVNGKIVKSRSDFDSYAELKKILEEYKPDIIGLRTLTFFNQFFHKTAAVIRNWEFDIPIIAGGPYATSDYKRILHDRNVDLVVLGEGEITFAELVGKIMKNDGKLPGEEVLKEIAGLAFMPVREATQNRSGRDIIMLDLLSERLSTTPGENLVHSGHPSDLAYAMYTSGSTGKPKGVLVKHRNVVRLVKNTNIVDFSQDNRVLPTGALDFDASTFEIWGALLNGSRLHLADKETILTPETLKAIIRTYDITLMWLTSPLFNYMVEADIDIFSGLVILVVGGDALSPAHINKVRKRYPVLKIINGYGPTENTTFSTVFSIEREYEESIPIGRPIANSTAYILDRWHRLVPVGVVGELCVGGDGLSRGYLNNPELTKEKFVLAHSSWLTAYRSEKKASSPGELPMSDELSAMSCLYKTGDLCRWLADGNIEFSGRIDHQVKIRGYRIEPGEIKSHLLRHKDMKEVVVTVGEFSVEDGFGELKEEKYICAYFVAGKELSSSEIRQYLLNNLPDYMIPSYFMQLEKIPLNPNGKVDRKALPSPVIQASSKYAAPRDEIEKKLVEIWGDVLNRDMLPESAEPPVSSTQSGRGMPIGIDDDFFELGGHSLKATILISRIHKELNVKLELGKIFVTPTIRGLAEDIKSTSTEKYASIGPVEKKEYYALSSAQKRLYVLQQIGKDNTGYNLPFIFMLEGTLDSRRLQKTFEGMIERHEAFRTGFEMVDEEPVQRIHKENLKLQIENYNGGGTPDPIKMPTSNFQITNIIRNFICPFDLSHVPLLRVGLIKTGETRHLLLVDMHHIIADGMSMGVFVRDFMSLYEGKELPRSRIRYRDYVLWQNSEKEKEVAKTREAYWVKEFSGDIPGLNLPLDYPRPDVQTFAGNRREFVIDQEETALLKEIVKKENVTLFTVLLGVFNVLLSKLSGQEEIVVGVPTAGRNHADLEKIIGMFVNTLPMRNYPRGEMRFGDFIRKLSTRTLEAFENQQYPFEELVERLDVPRDVSRNPLFDVVFLLQNIDIPPLRIPGLTLTHYDYDPGIAKFDLMLVGDEVGEHLAFTLEYCTKLFKKETIERYISYFKRVVTEVTRGPSRVISSIEIISTEEKKQVLFEFNNTGRKYPGNKIIHHVFEEQTARVPDGVAVLGRIAGDYLYVTYNQLNEKSDRVARLLREEGVQPGTIVGIMTDRSFEMIIGILGILKAGGAYLPILPNTPPERINYILRDSNTRLVLTQKEHIHLHKQGLGDGTALIDLGDDYLYRGKKVNLKAVNKPNHVAYVIYTSGSTGKPKGVMVNQGSVVNLLYALDDRYPFTPTDTYLLKTSYIFDVSVTELYGWFWGGGRMAVLEKGAEKDPDAILDMIENVLVTHINFVPSMFNTFVSILNPGNIGRLSGLKYLFLAGEPITPGSLHKFRGLNSRCQLENIYGPTEAAVYGSWYSLADWKGSGPIPIGQPLHNVQLYIVDKYDNLQPVGVLGELCIAGAGVARGYLNRPELTAEKFVSVTYRSYKSYRTYISSKKIYKTGDLARWTADGNIEFFGRIDHQVKIRGFRVEPGEIESQLLTYDGIKQAVVTTNEDNDGNRYLCAYIAADNRWEASELRERMSKKLPDYMIPAFFVQLDKIPLTAGGKLDRQALPEPRRGEKGERYQAPADEVEEKLAIIWSQVLDIEKEKISMDTSFFHLGGHSLKAAVLVSKLHKELNVKVPMEEIFKNPRIRQLARYVKNLEKEKYIPVRQVEQKEYYPLSPIQKRFYIMNRMDPRSTGYNMPTVMVMEGETDRNKLENAFGRLIERHESLRTSFKMVEGEPVQEIHDDVPFAIEYYDAGSSYRNSTEGIEEIVKNFIRAFDFSLAPLLRVGLIRTGQPDQKHILVVDMHHIITDGGSQMILNRDFTAAYAGEELPPLNFQYKDFSQWQNSDREKEKRKKQEEYWLRVFEKEAPLLNLSTDYQRPEVRTFEGDTVEFTFTGEEADKVKAFASSYDITLYILLLAVYYVLLWKLSGDEDIIVGCASSGRSRSEFQQVVGLFVNLLALRNHPSKERTFEEFLLEVKERTLEAFANQDFPFESLVENVAGKRDFSDLPLMNAGFTMQNLEQLSAPGTEESRIWSISHDFIKISIKLDINLEVHEKGGQLLFVFQYALELFKKETIRAIIHYFRKIISAVMENPQAKLEEIEIVSEDEKYEVYSEIKESRESIYADFDF